MKVTITIELKEHELEALQRRNLALSERDLERWAWALLRADLDRAGREDLVEAPQP